MRLLLALSLLLALGVPAHAEIHPEYLLFGDPEIVVPDPVLKFSPRLVPLWLEALAHPEGDMQRAVCEAIVRARRGHVPGLEASVPILARLLEADETRPAVRLAAARALLDFDPQPLAPQIAAAAHRPGADLRQLLEPVLARWKYEPMYAAWRERVADRNTRHRELILAIRCLQAAGDTSAVPALLPFVHDRRGLPDVRTEAARATGALGQNGLEGEARRLLDGSPPLLERLCAVNLLAHHSGEAAQALLAQLALDTEPAIAVIALDRLVEIDPHLVLPLAEKSMHNADAKVRLAGARAYVLVPDPSRVEFVSELLDDPHPDVRGYVRESMYKLAREADLDAIVRSSATRMLAGDRWRGLEQAALLLAALDHKPVAARLAVLLDFDRPEVGIAAAWGLKTLAVPETLPAMLDKAERNTELRLKSGPVRGLDEQTAQLNEAFGKMTFRPAEPLLRRYIPKNLVMGNYSRSAAIWSLGLLHAGVVDEGLAAELLGRATDTGVPPEFPLVREMAAIAIGRMHATEQAEGLRKFLGNRFLANRFGVMVRWALVQCNSPPYPELEPIETGMTGWFLEPLDDPTP